jgi:hypothetical protein
MQINHEKQHKKKKNLLRKYRKSWFAFLIAGLLFSLSRVSRTLGQTSIYDNLNKKGH